MATHSRSDGILRIYMTDDFEHESTASSSSSHTDNSEDDIFDVDFDPSQTNAAYLTRSVFLRDDESVVRSIRLGDGESDTGSFRIFVDDDDETIDAHTLSSRGAGSTGASSAMSQLDRTVQNLVTLLKGHRERQEALTAKSKERALEEAEAQLAVNEQKQRDKDTFESKNSALELAKMISRFADFPANENGASEKPRHLKKTKHDNPGFYRSRAARMRVLVCFLILAVIGIVYVCHMLVNKNESSEDSTFIFDGPSSFDEDSFGSSTSTSKDISTEAPENADADSGLVVDEHTPPQTITATEPRSPPRTSSPIVSVESVPLPEIESMGPPLSSFSSKAELLEAIDDYLAAEDASQSESASKYGFPINQWQTGNITDFSNAFSALRNVNASIFNEDISGWDTSSARKMTFMFRKAAAFNVDISSWDVSNCFNMRGMFREATSFAPLSLNTWNTSRLVDARSLFGWSTNFNGKIDQWDVSHVVFADSMFRQAKAFNQDVSNWNLPSAKDLRNFARGATNFSQNLCSWGTRMLTLPDVAVDHMFEQTGCPVEGVSLETNAPAVCFHCSGFGL